MLKLGTTSGKPFTLPIDAVARTFAVMGIVGSGKTSAAKRLAEEMARIGLPWIALDPVGVWWGIRADATGRPGGYPAVVIGGPHGDLPLDRDAGARIAQALISENVCAVIDLSRESKKFWHTFVTDFALELMQLNPQTPRHLFVEEAPEFVPQRTRVDLTARCKEAVDRLIRLGRNAGYGFSLITQRPAEVDKSVLSQMENLFILRTVGAHDRKALREWMGERGVEETHEQQQVWREIKQLHPGEAWFWSPAWLRVMHKVQIAPSTTFHPGATRQVGKAIAAVELSDVQAFVSKLQQQLSKSVVAKPVAPTGQTPPHSRQDDAQEAFASSNTLLSHYQETESVLQNALAEQHRLRQRAQQAEAKLAAVRKLLQTDYDLLKAVFEEAHVGDGVAGSVDRNVYEPWLAKAGRRGCKRMLEVMIERPNLTRSQLATLSVVRERSSTFRSYLAWLKRNRLIETEGELVKLRALT